MIMSRKSKGYVKKKARFIAIALSMLFISTFLCQTAQIKAVTYLPVEEDQDEVTSEDEMYSDADTDEDMDASYNESEEDDTNINQSNTEVVTAPLGELVAHWTFDGNYKESVNHMDTQLGAKAITYTDGIYGKAAVFNGKDNYLCVDNDILNLGNYLDEDNDNFTISAWVNLGDSKSDDKVLLNKGEDIGWDRNDDRYYTDPYRIEFDGCEAVVTLYNDFEDNNTGYRTEGASTTRGKYVQGNEWFLLTVTYDGKRVKIYHDNLLLNQSNYSDGITFNHENLYIGVDGKLENFFKGAVDDLRIYTKTLSYDEVVDLYEAGLKANKEFVEPTKQLVAYYAFDDNLKDASTFKNDAEKVAASGTIKYIIGKNGKAITMSKGSYIRVPAATWLNLEDEFTVSFWLKINSEGEYPIIYMLNPSYTDDDDNDYTYKLTVDSYAKGENTNVSMNTWVYNPDMWTPNEGQNLLSYFSYDNEKVKSTNWVHYTYTYQDGQMKFYLNGKLQNKSDKSDLINISNASGDLLIGYDGNTFLSGAIDELKISTICANADEVKKEAARIDKISISSDDSKKIAKITKGKTVAITSVLLKDGDTGKTSKLKTTDKNITYKSSNSKIFKVSKDGKLTAIKGGKAKITITYGCHTATYSVVVK